MRTAGNETRTGENVRYSIRQASPGTWAQLAAAVLLTASVAISPNKDAYEIAGVPLFITLTSAGILLSIWGIALDFRGASRRCSRSC